MVMPACQESFVFRERPDGLSLGRLSRESKPEFAVSPFKVLESRQDLGS